ncbi:50S ribosomal protein L23 [Candidatus Nomurabacteria bacterium]|nr:50S ribosomal protein L23 [Candidatus Nomurabacteria bacterium]
MALFSRKTKTQESKDAAPKVTSHKKALVTDRNLESVIQKPRLTEKAVQKGEQNVYTFVVRRDATKYDVRDAVKALFGVTPVKVNIVNKAPRSYQSRSKGRTVSEKGLKKAYVYLKDGDSINLV